jgi:hypothetical protein
MAALAFGVGVVGFAQQRAPLPALQATGEISGVVVSNDASRCRCGAPSSPSRPTR